MQLWKQAGVVHLERASIMTFYEMLNRVRFRDIAGRCRKETDLPALRALLVEKLFRMQSDATDIANALKLYGYPLYATRLIEDYNEVCGMLENDIVVIEAYCRARDIIIE